MYKNSLTLDLSKKTPDEIAEFLQALIATRHVLLKKGFNITHRRVKLPKFSILSNLQNSDN